MPNATELELDRLRSELRLCRKTLERAHPWICDYATFSDETEKAKKAMLDEIRKALFAVLRDD